jgi:hypothetical protein
MVLFINVLKSFVASFSQKIPSFRYIQAMEFQTLDVLHFVEGGHDDELITVFAIQFFQVLPAVLSFWICQDPAQNSGIFRQLIEQICGTVDTAIISGCSRLPN